MKIAGLIAEYNPFHNGHLYHIQETKRITGADAVLVWAWNCIHTERFAHDVFTSDYGQDLAGLIGKPYGDEVRQSEAVRKLREALLINPYITSVDQVSATFEGSWLHVSFSLHTIYGEVSVRDAAIGI